MGSSNRCNEPSAFCRHNPTVWNIVGRRAEGHELVSLCAQRLRRGGGTAPPLNVLIPHGHAAILSDEPPDRHPDGLGGCRGVRILSAQTLVPLANPLHPFPSPPPERRHGRPSPQRPARSPPAAPR